MLRTLSSTNQVVYLRLRDMFHAQSVFRLCGALRHSNEREHGRGSAVAEYYTPSISIRLRLRRYRYNALWKVLEVDITAR